MPALTDQVQVDLAEGGQPAVGVVDLVDRAGPVIHPDPVIAHRAVEHGGEHPAVGVRERGLLAAHQQRDVLGVVAQGAHHRPAVAGGVGAQDAVRVVGVAADQLLVLIGARAGRRRGLGGVRCAGVVGGGDATRLGDVVAGARALAAGQRGVDGLRGLGAGGRPDLGSGRRAGRRGIGDRFGRRRGWLPQPLPSPWPAPSRPPPWPRGLRRRCLGRRLRCRCLGRRGLRGRRLGSSRLCGSGSP